MTRLKVWHGARQHFGSPLQKQKQGSNWAIQKFQQGSKWAIQKQGSNGAIQKFKQGKDINQTPIAGIKSLTGLNVRKQMSTRINKSNNGIPNNNVRGNTGSMSSSECTREYWINASFEQIQALARKSMARKYNHKSNKVIDQKSVQVDNQSNQSVAIKVSQSNSLDQTRVFFPKPEKTELPSGNDIDKNVP